MRINNQEFLQAIFKKDAPFAHVTSFQYDPNNIPSDQHLHAWKGGYNHKYTITPNTNQYFTISIFNPNANNVARRRKALFLRTRIIVLDDVREKLSIDAVSKLPSPSYVLETSKGSEQWGYILTTPATDRQQVENLLDGLIQNGLAPDGRDPGMKGVTRYVRLPDGYNNKSNKLTPEGLPFKCRLISWHPERTTTLQALAAPFSVNLTAPRKDTRLDGASDIPDHPLLQIPDLIHIKQIRSEGRFDITCPWTSNHTGDDDSGAAIFTNDDGSIGFKCHHGGCQHRTAKHLILYIDDNQPGFGATFQNWRMKRVFSDVLPHAPAVSFLQPDSPASPDTIYTILNALKRERHTSQEARTLAQKILKTVDSLPAIERQHWHNEIADLMHWTKPEIKSILKDLRNTWYDNSKSDSTFVASFIFIKPKNRFYDYKSKEFYTPEAFQNSFMDQDTEARKTALQDGTVEKVDKIDFAPRQPRVFDRRGIRYGNTWCANNNLKSTTGDCSKWYDHWDVMGWAEHREHHLKWMAYTLKHPEDKINHILIMGSMEGTGKDFLLSPFIQAMGDYTTTIDGDELLSNHNEYILSTKHLHINETDLGDHREAKQISNKLKRIAASPPLTLRVNPKGITALDVTNIVNSTMTCNTNLPIQLSGPSRRFYATWSDLNVRDKYDEMLPTWVEYWNDRWPWMINGGYKHCIHHLLNNVDISDFNPGSPPPMTDFLRNIREASKSPAQQTIEGFIQSTIGAFSYDLVTASDISSTIKAASITHGDMIYCDATWFTPMKVGKVLSDITSCSQIRGRDGRRDLRLWSIRNTEKYKAMTPASVINEYDNRKKHKV